MAKYQIDVEKMKEELKNEISVTQLLEKLGLPKEAKPYIFHVIKKLNAMKVKPGVYKLG